MDNYLTSLLKNRILIFESGESKIQIGDIVFVYTPDAFEAVTRNGLNMKKLTYLVPRELDEKPHEQYVDALCVWVDAQHHTIYEVVSYAYSGFVFKSDSTYGTGVPISMSLNKIEYFNHHPDDLEVNYVIRKLK